MMVKAPVNGVFRDDVQHTEILCFHGKSAVAGQEPWDAEHPDRKGRGIPGNSWSVRRGPPGSSESCQRLAQEPLVTRSSDVKSHEQDSMLLKNMSRCGL